MLTDRGLDAALSGLAARSPVPVAVDGRPGRRREPAPAVEAIAYFVVAEALTNVAKHAAGDPGRGRASRRLDGMLRVVVTDDGLGGADPRPGTGLRGLRRPGARRRRPAAPSTARRAARPSLTVELPCAS